MTLSSLAFLQDGSAYGEIDSRMPTYTQATNLSLLDPGVLAQALRTLIEATQPLRCAYDETSADRSASAGGWSTKQVFGHLIDSAGNNLQRIVRLQIDTELRMPGYKQAEWVAVQHYSERTWQDVFLLWSGLNLHLAHVIEQTKAECLSRTWFFDDGEMTLGFLIEDYIAHLQHHLDRLPAPLHP
jgi:hypothetical protein